MRREIGYKEKDGQLTKFGQWYAHRVQDTQYRDAPWCDMFLAWAADKAGLTDYVGSFAWTPSHAAWFMKQGAWTQKPEPGALVFFDWRGGKSYKGIDHVGIVERVTGAKIHTIEANVDRVWLKRKTRETDKVVGYGIPRLVKENLNEIRSTERPFVPAPRAEPEHGTPLDVLGTPPALLAVMVLTTIVLSLRVAGRRRGTHRRLRRLWNAPTAPDPPGAEPRRSAREEGSAREREPARKAARETARETASAGAAHPAGTRARSGPAATAAAKGAAVKGAVVKGAAARGSGAATAAKRTAPGRRRPYERG
ncbi:CHAP domain-containing protein [Nonomuraea phyllanthi]|uniref:CHAP domain-containing protein n=1 Tax=Nonomuraea phyllanthi TaxID=2219224 RepID=A0A5C4WWW4_9ACTN|nr:CHAP domain-containing protein [Nonomuraea phyllanthi]KAB8197326.1 CHAP domain-containing protein [Nonomuraea phyllanthi]QFY06679.1 CHAP domain-containing protein [Nonomuraea phyllanthi]